MTQEHIFFFYIIRTFAAKKRSTKFVENILHNFENANFSAKRPSLPNNVNYVETKKSLTRKSVFNFNYERAKLIIIPYLQFIFVNKKISSRPSFAKNRISCSIKVSVFRKLYFLLALSKEVVKDSRRNIKLCSNDIN